MELTPTHEYVHNLLNEEVIAIGGHYVVTKEIRFPTDGEDILYTIGYGVMDTTCCGTGGCAYATVHGFIVDWKGKQNREGLPVTIIQPIRDNQLKKELHEKILSEEIVQQVNFM